MTASALPMHDLGDRAAPSIAGVVQSVLNMVLDVGQHLAAVLGQKRAARNKNRVVGGVLPDGGHLRGTPDIGKGCSDQNLMEPNNLHEDWIQRPHCSTVETCPKSRGLRRDRTHRTRIACPSAETSVGQSQLKRQKLGLVADLIWPRNTGSLSSTDAEADYVNNQGDVVVEDAPEPPAKRLRKEPLASVSGASGGTVVQTVTEHRCMCGATVAQGSAENLRSSAANIFSVAVMDGRLATLLDNSQRTVASRGNHGEHMLKEKAVGQRDQTDALQTRAVSLLSSSVADGRLAELLSRWNRAHRKLGGPVEVVAKRARLF